MTSTTARVGLRRLGLAGSGLTFGVIALLSLITPEKVAAQYAFTLGSPDAWNEFHAIFTGFWLGLCAIMLVAARRVEQRLLGDLAGMAIGLQALGRLLAILAHGTPSGSFTSAMVGELITSALILQGGPLVPKRPPS
jgi:hypothetical protein